MCCGLGRTTNSFENHNIYLIISSFRPAESRQRPQMRAKIPPGPPSAPDASPRFPLGRPMSPQGAPRTPQCPPKDRPRVPNATQSPPLEPPRCVEWSFKLCQGLYFPTSDLRTPNSDLRTPTSDHERDGADVGCPMSWGRRQGALAR